MSLKAGRVGVRPDQVDAQGYITGSGGGGGGDISTLEIKKIGEMTTFNAPATLDEDPQDYDLIVFMNSTTYQGGIYKISSIYPASEITSSVSVCCYVTEVGNCFCNINGKTMTITLISVSNLAKIEIFGIRISKEED